MTAIVECVPNFSEGRKPEVVEAITRAIRGVADVQVLSVSSDASHNRTVVTFIGPPEAVSEAAFRSIAVACNRINMNEHQGEHPRIGAADVVPLVPVRDISLSECAELARQLGRRVGDELGQPVYLFEAAATRPERRDLADIRRGEYEAWKEQVASDPARQPDYGPAQAGPAGATVIGARPFLVAYNVYLSTDDVEIARQIARHVRQRDGGLRYVKALGLLVDGQAQVSMNLTDISSTPLHRVVELIRSEALRFGCAITRCELVGLIPEAALIQSAQWYLQLHDLAPEQLLEHHLPAPGLAEPEAEAEGFAAITPTPFLDAVAAGTAAPGGGAVAALAGGLAAALGSMVARLTLGRKDYAELDPEMQRMATEFDALRVLLTADVVNDANAYQAVMIALGMPKESEERKDALERALMNAGEVPLHVARVAMDVLRLLVPLADSGYVNAITDAGAGAYMARAAIEVAALNVLVNALYLSDSELAAQWRTELTAMRSEMEQLVATILAATMTRGGLEGDA